MMLALSRKTGQKILIGDDIVIGVADISQGRVTIGVEAPKHITILREEVRDNNEGDDHGEVSEVPRSQT